jgi:hypothetical protein
MSKELDRARNLCARRPIPPAIRQLIEPLKANAPESESADFAELHAVIDELLPIEKPKAKRKKKDAEPLRTQEVGQEEEEKADEEIN